MTNFSYYIPIEQTPAFQNLVGGVPKGTITAFLGAPQAGKSAMAIQLGIEVAQVEEGNFMIFDTENKFHQHLHLAQALAERFTKPLNLVRVKAAIKVTGKGDEKKYQAQWDIQDEVDPEAINIFTVHCPDIQPISIMHGRGVDLVIFESGKFKVTMLKDAWAATIQESLLAQFVEKHKIKCILYDSITNPLDEIPAVGENFPARADLTQSWMIQIHKLATAYDLPILATFHESKNETNPFGKDLKVEGGKGVGYNLNYIVYLLLKNEMGLLPKGSIKPQPLASDERAVLVARHPGRKPWSEVQYITITDSGLVAKEQ